MTEQLKPMPKADVVTNPKPTLKLRLNPNNTHYVEARNGDELRAARMLGLNSTLPTK